MILAQQHELTSARDHLAQAIKLYGNAPSAALSRYSLAKVFIEENELDKALEELNASIALRPDYAEAFLAQGLVRKQ